MYCGQGPSMLPDLNCLLFMRGVPSVLYNVHQRPHKMLALSETIKSCSGGSEIAQAITHAGICQLRMCTSPLSVARRKAQHSPVAVVRLFCNDMLKACIPHGCLDVHLVVQVAVRLRRLHQREERRRQVLNGL